MRHTTGWVKIFRKIEKNWVAKDPVAYALWCRLLIWANYEDTKYRQGAEIKVVKRGEILTSIRELAGSWNIHRDTVKNLLTSLSRDGMITVKYSHLGCHVTICNYEQYQGSGTDDPATECTTECTTDRPHNVPLNQHLIRNKEYKEIKENKNTPPTPSGDVNCFLDIWNANCGDLAKASFSEKRARSIKARLKENPELSYWEKVIIKLAASDFCCGRIEDKTKKNAWKANLDWLIRPDNHLKVMEGNYDNRTSNTPQSSAIAAFHAYTNQVLEKRQQSS